MCLESLCHLLKLHLLDHVLHAKPSTATFIVIKLLLEHELISLEQLRQRHSYSLHHLLRLIRFLQSRSRLPPYHMVNSPISHP